MIQLIPVIDASHTAGLTSSQLNSSVELRFTLCSVEISFLVAVPTLQTESRSVPPL